MWNLGRRRRSTSCLSPSWHGFADLWVRLVRFAGDSWGFHESPHSLGGMRWPVRLGVGRPDGNRWHPRPRELFLDGVKELLV
jgi:hypothetical protein